MANLWNVAKKAYALLFVLGALFAVVFVLYILIKNWKEILPSISLLLPILITIYFLYKYTSLQGPMKHFANRLFLKAYNLLIYRRRFLWEQLYDFLCYVIPSTEWKHMNWGYAPMSKDGIMLRNLKKEDENERYSIQLYHYMATCLNKWDNLEGKTLMEVSSGRGGGIDYLSRYLNPKKCIGVDISQVQIDYCRNIYRNNSKLMFVNGDSQALSRIPDLRNEAIDIVINVESGHCYPDFKRFLQEVDRVLVPGGFFAYSDFRPSHEWEKVEDQLESFSMKIVQKVNISDNVMHSLTLDEDRKSKLIQDRLSPALRFFFKQIGGVKGSHIFEGLSKKTMKSMAYVLQKPEVKKT